MERQRVNLYIDSLLSFSEGDSALERLELVEIASNATSLGNLLAEWLWLKDKSSESALELMLWFNLNYNDLGDIFGYSVREINQLIRGLRVARLGAYPPVSKLAAKEKSGSELSCFMVEQRLSSWIDSEWEDFSGLKEMQKHLDQCSSCQKRLAEYRQLQSQIMESRSSFQALSVEEWSSSLQLIELDRSRRRLRWMLLGFVFVAILSVFCWWLWERPEKMPNIYELSEN